MTPRSNLAQFRRFDAAYPWSIWLNWSLEDRVLTLGEYINQTDDAAARTIVEADLVALAGWKSYRESARLDLAFAHAVRILWIAVSQWGWLSEDLRRILRAAIQRAVEDGLPFSNQLYGQFDTLQALLTTAHPYQHPHNIPLIGT